MKQCLTGRCEGKGVCEPALGTAEPGEKEEKVVLHAWSREFPAVRGGSVKQQTLPCTHDRDFVVVTGE